MAACRGSKFEVYSELLGLNFERSERLATWHPEVVAFEVTEGQQLVGHLFLDQFPRPDMPKRTPERPHVGLEA